MTRFQFGNTPFKRVQSLLDPRIGVTAGHHFAGQHLRKAGNALLEVAKSLIDFALESIEVLAQILPLSANLLKQAQGMVLGFRHVRGLDLSDRRYVLTRAR